MVEAEILAGEGFFDGDVVSGIHEAVAVFVVTVGLGDGLGIVRRVLQVGPIGGDGDELVAGNVLVSMGDVAVLVDLDDGSVTFGDAGDGAVVEPLGRWDGGTEIIGFGAVEGFGCGLGGARRVGGRRDRNHGQGRGSRHGAGRCRDWRR